MGELRWFPRACPDLFPLCRFPTSRFSSFAASGRPTSSSDPQSSPHDGSVEPGHPRLPPGLSFTAAPLTRPRGGPQNASIASCAESGPGRALRRRGRPAATSLGGSRRRRSMRPAVAPRFGTHLAMSQPSPHAPKKYYRRNFWERTSEGLQICWRRDRSVVVGRPSADRARHPVLPDHPRCGHVPGRRLPGVVRLDRRDLRRDVRRAPITGPLRWAFRLGSAGADRVGAVPHRSTASGSSCSTSWPAAAQYQKQLTAVAVIFFGVMILR